MKKALLLPLMLILFISFGFGKAPYTEFKVGYFDPEASDAGYLFGLNMGRMIDESLSWSFEFNYFQRTYKRVTTIDELRLPSGSAVEEKALELEYTTRIIPVLLKLNWEHPLGYQSPFYLRASGGLGWQMVWDKENNFVTGEHQTRFFHGFGWQAAAGVGIGISSSANFFVDLFYNSSTAKRNQETNSVGLPTWEEMNISGFGIKIGVSIVGFGW